ncbi:MAG: hypothetical protein KGD65_05820 [Candidatus Lokiarchaeota archaeon]|nr:hypothetical protein [Candidatus Lokiarchaeota archaeon]
MTQAYEEVMEMKSIEVEEIVQPEVQENEVDELLGDLNPRYFEEATSLNKTKDRIYSAKAHSDNIFNTHGF